MLLLLLLTACRVELGPPGAAQQEGKPTVWVYTAIHQDQVDQFSAAIARELPDIDVEWFQGGSEKVAQRWEAGHSAGASPACVLATSDPSWYVDLTRRALLHPYVSPRALEKSFSELTEPAWKGHFSSGDPFSWWMLGEA